MRKSISIVAVPLLSASLVLSGCGQSSTPTTSTANSTATASASADPVSQCPTENTQSFPKTRFVTNVGLAAGAFYQWIYKPYQNGKFTKGAEGRTTAMVKAGLAGAFAAKQVKDATENVKADPTLCKAFITPMTKLTQQFDAVGDRIRSGDMSAVTGLAGTMSEVEGLAKQKGMEITPKDPGL